MRFEPILNLKESFLLSGTPAGFDGKLLAGLSERMFAESKNMPIFVARDDGRMAAIEASIRFFAPELEILIFPAWDCLPYDRVSPAGHIMAQRMATLFALARRSARKPAILLTTVNAVLQRVVPQASVKSSSLVLKTGTEVSQDKVIGFLSENGFNRTSQVIDTGEFAVRGGLIDLFAPDTNEPVRLDFFGDEIDTIRTFDPTDQRSLDKIDKLILKPAGEVKITPQHCQTFQRNYVAEFGPAKGNDPLYEAIKEGRKIQGCEHWLPFFYDGLETLFDYIDNSRMVLDYQANEAIVERFATIEDYYSARQEALNLTDKKSDLSNVYKPVPAETMFLNEAEWESIKETAQTIIVSPFQAPDGMRSIDMKAKAGRNFSPERQNRGANVYDAVVGHAQSLQNSGKRIVFACYSGGAAERMTGVLEDHGLSDIRMVENWANIRTSPKNSISVTVLPIESGFETEALALITEQDILGDRLVRSVRRQRKAENFITEASALEEGDLVVHTSHGIGRFCGLETLEIQNAKHDCLLILYAGDSKLYVPVENIEVLSKFGNDSEGVQLDKLGGAAWQARKAKLKERIREMAEGLIKLAAKRALKEGQKVTVPDGIYDEFSARFPYSETDDQLRAIADVTRDLAGGKPMDRLICGDVGFGKTEVALRAAFLNVMAGHQVAVIAPTTLLARQHYNTFSHRFKGLPVRVGQLSRLVKAKDAKLVKDELQSGQLDIVIGTHALLAKDIKFKNLSMVVVDEEQHFGVAHKERLKELKADVHVLTLTATPIPRTLQMAMSGIRDLSIIATPPVDRLAIRTYVSPFDAVTIREALLREHYRGGQSFYVCPRISDLDTVAGFLRDHVPEVKFAVAHGQMAPTEIERVMTAFYDGQYDVLVSTTIIESGIDIARANTMIVHRADRFGLAQLYQLRGRVGRSKIRAYAYLTVPANRLLSEKADKRLNVLQTLDTLGAGFSIASHDLDIRGAGNLLGEEQSGQVREVGVELYQKMLEEAVAEARSGLADEELVDTDWSPVLNLGATVMIPETYIPDLDQRLALYRRLADLTTREDVDAFLAELIDRFGPLPGAVKQLGAIMIIKGHAKRAGIEKLEAGPKGLVISFKDNQFADPAGLVEFISKTGQSAKVRPDHSLVYYARMEKTSTRLKTAAAISRQLATIADKSASKAA